MKLPLSEHPEEVITKGETWIIMKITIDRENCSSCGTCWEGCPEIFEQNPDDSFSQIVEKYRLNGNNAEGRPAEEFEDCSARAAEDCCAEVIHVEEK